MRKIGVPSVRSIALSVSEIVDCEMPSDLRRARVRARFDHAHENTQLPKLKIRLHDSASSIDFPDVTDRHFGAPPSHA